MHDKVIVSITFHQCQATNHSVIKYARSQAHPLHKLPRQGHVCLPQHLPGMVMYQFKKHRASMQRALFTSPAEPGGQGARGLPAGRCGPVAGLHCQGPLRAPERGARAGNPHRAYDGAAAGGGRCASCGAGRTCCSRQGVRQRVSAHAARRQERLTMVVSLCSRVQPLGRPATDISQTRRVQLACVSSDTCQAMKRYCGGCARHTGREISIPVGWKCLNCSSRSTAYAT